MASTVITELFKYPIVVFLYKYYTVINMLND
jgi:hypothetical protein